jgi:hypothetical protein
LNEEWLERMREMKEEKGEKIKQEKKKNGKIVNRKPRIYK